MTKYGISFYLPDDPRECAVFSSDTPFQTVNVGNEIVGVTWKNAPYPREEITPVAKVSKVVRAVSEIGGTIHDVILVYTESL